MMKATISVRLGVQLRYNETGPGVCVVAYPLFPLR